MKGLAILLLACLTPTMAQAEFTRAPYVQLATENSIHIVWRTQMPVEPFRHQMSDR